MAVIILALLSLAILAGLYFYNRSFAPKSRGSQRTSRVLTFADFRVKEDEHEVAG